MTNFTYRPDVDGLRAVAVLIVLLFHAGFGCPGGYVGVDVFFVISGFLITGMILRERKLGTFRMSSFWVRRIRRIFPASLVAVSASLATGYFLLLPSNYVDLAKSAIAQQLMLSNVWFWRNTSYFAVASDYKPLLHTWSLGVEEQFYLWYPLGLVFLTRYRERTIALTLLCLSLTSFALSEAGVRRSAGATFYLLPTRAWELLVGGLICFLPENSLRRWQNNMLSAAGLLAILSAAYGFTSTTRFPGVAAILPCAGAFAFIFAGATHSDSPVSLFNTFLASRPVVFIGLISYSVYLWHWPLLAFPRILFGNHLSPGFRAGALSAAFVLGYISWRFVETPFRKKNDVVSATQAACLAVAATASVIVAALAIIFGSGLPGRFLPTVVEYDNVSICRSFVHQVTTDQIRSGSVPTFGEKNSNRTCIVWGDSHAMSLIPGIDAACRAARIRGYQITHASTPPILDFVKVEEFGLNYEAPEFNRAALNFAMTEQVNTVIIAGLWSSYHNNPRFQESLTATVKELQNSGINVTIVLDVARQKCDVPRVLSTAAILGWDTDDDELRVSLKSHREVTLSCEAVIRGLVSQGVYVIDPADVFVDEQLFWPGVFGTKALYRDEHHLSVEGSLRLTPLFTQMFNDPK